MQGRFQRVTPGDVERVVKRCVHGAGLLSVDLAQVRRAIHTLPWVDAVSVERDWPRGLTVLVVEQTAAARWGERGLLNTRGELFDSDERHVPPELAQLEGPEGKEALVAQRYLAAEGRLLQAGRAHHGAAPGCARRLGVRPRQRRDGALGKAAGG